MSIRLGRIHAAIDGVLAITMVVALMRLTTFAGDGPLGLWGAAARGDPDEVTRFVNSGADLNGTRDAYGLTPLMWAAGNGHLAVVKLLLSNGAEVDAKGRDGRTALICCLWGSAMVDGRGVSGKDHPEVLKLLLGKSADVNARDGKGRPALMWAAGRGNAEALIMLLQKGANVNAKDETGSTALMGAASRGETVLGWPVGKGHVEAARLLLENGADLNARDKNGLSALRIAQRNGYKIMEDFLRSRGAKE